MQSLFPHHIGTLSPASVADAHPWPTSGLWLRAVMVSTADGAAVSPSGQSTGISSAADRLVFATIRGMADVILVGAATVRQDTYGPISPRPELSARRVESEQAPMPRIAILTRSGDLDTSARLFTECDEPPIVFAPESLGPERAAELREVAELVTLGSESVPLAGALDHLRGAGLSRVVCEGGPSLLGDLTAEELLDELCLTITPLLAGGAYPDQPAIPRILSGATLSPSPVQMELVHVLQDSGTLFLRYVRR